MAPECIQFKVYSMKTDTWSFGKCCHGNGVNVLMMIQGVFMYELLVKEMPYKELTTIAAASAVIHKGLRLQLPQHLANEWKTVHQVMSECFADKPKDRPEFSQICTALAAEQE
jgi:serine/threonine protein kinase